MLNNIFLVDLPENEIKEIKELCNLALVAIQGAESQATYININAKEGKMQLKLNAAKSSTFMCVISKNLAESLEYQLPNIFKLRVMYIYESIEDFRGILSKNFPIFEDNQIIEEVIEEDITGKEIEEVVEDDIDESKNTLVIEDINNDNIEYMRSYIKALESRNLSIIEELNMLKETLSVDAPEDYGNKLKISESKVEMLVKELQVVNGKVELNDIEIKRLNDRLKEAQENAEKLEEEVESLAHKNEELVAMVDDSSEKNTKIMAIVKEKEIIESELKTTASELLLTRANYDNAKEVSLQREKEYSELSLKYNRMSSSPLARLGESISYKAVIADTLLEHDMIKDCYVIGSGSNENIHETALYIRRAIKNTSSNVLVIDLEYDTFVDYILEAVSPVEYNLLDYIEGKTDNINKCLIPTAFKNIKYCRLTTGFLNDASLLNVNWSILMNMIAGYNGKVVIHIGNISGVFKGVLLNTFSRFMRVHVVARMTTVNIRCLLITLSAIKNLTNLTCICVRPNDTNNCPAYDKLAKKYITKIISKNDAVSL